MSQIFDESLENYRKLAETNPRVYLPSVAISLNNLGNLQSKNNQLEAAGNSLSEALGIYNEIAKTNPQMHLPYVAMILNNLGEFENTRNNQSKAREYLQECVISIRQHKKLLDGKLVPLMEKYYDSAVGFGLNSLGMSLSDFEI